MDKPNFLQKAAEFFGFSAERVEVMTSEEKTKLEGFGAQIAEAENSVEALTAQVNSATEALVRVEAESAEKDATIESLNASLVDKDAQIAQLTESLAAAQAEIESLGAQLAALPGAETTSTASEKDPDISTEPAAPVAFESETTKAAKALIGK